MYDEDALGHLREARAALLDKADEIGGSRELSLAITKVDEAILWHLEDMRLRRPPINEKAGDQGPPEFDIADDGTVTLLDGWKRDNYTTRLRLMMAAEEIAPETLAAWSDEQHREAQLWAVATAFAASDNAVKVPARPDFLPAR